MLNVRRHAREGPRAPPSTNARAHIDHSAAFWTGPAESTLRKMVERAVPRTHPHRACHTSGVMRAKDRAHHPDGLTVHADPHTHIPTNADSFQPTGCQPSPNAVTP